MNEVNSKSVAECRDKLIHQWIVKKECALILITGRPPCQSPETCLNINTKNKQGVSMEWCASFTSWGDTGYKRECFLDSQAHLALKHPLLYAPCCPRCRISSNRKVLLCLPCWKLMDLRLLRKWVFFNLPLSMRGKNMRLLALRQGNLYNLAVRLLVGY